MIFEMLLFNKIVLKTHPKGFFSANYDIDVLGHIVLPICSAWKQRNNQDLIDLMGELTVEHLVISKIAKLNLLSSVIPVY